MLRDSLRRFALASCFGALALYACTADIQGNPDHPEKCADALDNDNDGATDCADSDCASTSDCAAGAEDCNNLADEDGDGLADCDDPDCASNAACLPSPEECANGDDDDLDGLADCADPDCASASGCEAPALVILTPAEGDGFERDEFNASFEFVTVPLLFTAAASDAAIVEVEYLTENGFSLGVGTAPDFAVEEPFRIDGNRTVTAHGRNAAGAEIASAEVHFEIRPPVDEACVNRLLAEGADVTVAAPTLGIHTPIKFKSPMKGITYLPFGASAPRADGELASCLLAEALVNAAPHLTARGITTIEHLGIYNFRCIGGGDPLSGTCNPSQHAFAKGIDIHELRRANGETFNVETDWIIDTPAGSTCTAATSNAKDELLHRVACDDLHDASDRFHIVLTPNFNADHRNHFHIDLTNGSNFIQTGGVIDPAWPMPIGD
jgi:hypothetical protein